ncbi:MAG TPA: hypothetical protein VK903_06910 [Propionicimonas sp.]|nr:hypothetical protein [Propionicimonas sp.]
MSTQPPVRFENYPPDDSAGRSDLADEHTPVVRPYVPDTIPPPPARDGNSRRTLIGLVVGIPVAGIILSVFAANGSTTPGPDGYLPDYTEYTEDPEDPEAPVDPEDAEPVEEEFSVGDYSATVPAGWTVNDDGSGAVEVTTGANRLAAVSIETATSTLAVEEIARIAKPHHPGFKGKVGTPVDRSSAALQHATMDGTGTFRGKAARLLVELWIDEDGTGLLVARVLTAKVASAISRQAQGMVDEMSGEF